MKKAKAKTEKWSQKRTLQFALLSSFILWLVIFWALALSINTPEKIDERRQLRMQNQIMPLSEIPKIDWRG